MLTSASIPAPLPPLPSKRKLKPKAPNTTAIWDSLASARGYKGKGKEKEQDRETEEEKEKELEKEEKTAKEKENANEIGEKDLNGKEVSLPVDPTALREQTNSASLQPVTSISTQRRKRKMGTATTISENREKQTRFAPLSINGHTSCPPTPLLDESISTSLSRRSSRLKEPNAKKPPPEAVKLDVSLES
jgi:helicase SWR1